VMAVCYYSFACLQIIKSRGLDSNQRNLGYESSA
jgi:hypothetical protein